MIGSVAVYGNFQLLPVCLQSFLEMFHRMAKHSVASSFASGAILMCGATVALFPVGRMIVSNSAPSVICQLELRKLLLGCLYLRITLPLIPDANRRETISKLCEIGDLLMELEMLLLFFYVGVGVSRDVAFA